MAETGSKTRRFTWAPKALAVISCALALLAAQPVGGTGSEPALLKGSVVVREGGALVGEVPDRVTAARTTERQAARAAGWYEQTLLRSARQWRILATVEILHRLLAVELRGVERHVMPVVWVGDVCVGLVAEPVGTPGQVEMAAGVPLREQAFAIRHCLLAPPIC